METGFPCGKPLWKYQWIIPLREKKKEGGGRGRTSHPLCSQLMCEVLNICTWKSLGTFEVRCERFADHFLYQWLQGPQFFQGTFYNKFLSTTSLSSPHWGVWPPDPCSPSPAIHLAQQIHYSWVPKFQDPVTLSGKSLSLWKSGEVNTHYHAFWGFEFNLCGKLFSLSHEFQRYRGPDVWLQHDGC